MKRLLSCLVDRELADGTINFLFVPLIATFLLYAVLVVIPTGRFWLDEGNAADIANQLLHGKSLYRDVSAPYGPIAFYLYTISFTLFGKSFFYIRLIGLFIILLQGLFLFLSTRLLIGNKIIALMAPLVLFISLGMWQGDRVTASTLAGLFTVAILYLHIKYLYFGGKWRVFTIGLLLGFSLLAKHNVFVFDVVANGAIVIYVSLQEYLKNKKLDWAYIILIPCGTIVVVLPYLIYVHEYFALFLEDTLMNKSRYASIMGIPFPVPSNLIRELLRMDFRALVYSLSLYSALLLTFPAIKHFQVFFRGTQQKSYAILLILMISYAQLLQVFPLSDYSHYARATMTLPVLMVLLLLVSIKNRSLISLALTICAISMHVGPMLLSQRSSVINALSLPLSDLPYNEHIRRDPREDAFINVLNEIDSSGEEKMLVIGHHEVLYFLSDRTHITRQTSVSPYYIYTEEAQQEVITDIEKENVRLVIVGAEVRPDTDVDKLPLLNEHLHAHFSLIGVVDGYRIWNRTSSSMVEDRVVVNK